MIKHIGRYLKAPLWLLSSTPYKRTRVLQEFARLSASAFGDFPVLEADRLWREDREFFRNYKSVAPENPFSEDRNYTLREFIRFTEDVPGDIVECGCYKGASAWFMANEVPDTTLHLFDSFEGVSVPDERDIKSGLSESYWKSGNMRASEEDVRLTLSDFNNVSIYQGWIPERFQEVADLSFRLIHIDVDLYQPTLDSLNFFYPRLSIGGVIVMDDYGSTRCPGATLAAQKFAKVTNEKIIHLTTAQGIIIKRPSS